jgi:hypothetical protein
MGSHVQYTRTIILLQTSQISEYHFIVLKVYMISLGYHCIGRTADFGRWISVAQWSDASRRTYDCRACAVTLFCLSNNSDVEVVGSLLLVHPVLLPRAVCLFLQTREVRSIDSLSCSGSEGHRPRIIGRPIPLIGLYFILLWNVYWSINLNSTRPCSLTAIRSKCF